MAATLVGRIGGKCGMLLLRKGERQERMYLSFSYR